MAQRVLALDIGTVRIGIAVSDPLGMTAQPVEVWERRTVNADMAHMQELLRQYEVGTVVVGHPITMAGGKSPSTELAEAWAARLRTAGGCSVVLWDERLTSVQGERAMLEDNVRRSKRRIGVNVVAAQLLLQHYLDTQRGVEPTA